MNANIYKQSALFMKLFLTILAGLLLTVASPAWTVAATIQLPQTGQNLCYNSAGAVIDCTAQGQTQDGAIRAGKAWPNPRFTDNGNGTVTDNLTTMVWAKDANLMKTRDPGFDNDVATSSTYPEYSSIPGDGAVTWQHALDYIIKLNSENYLGYNDWRLPNVNEMQSLIDLGRLHLALPIGYPFSNVNHSYWSSTTVAGITSNAWHVLTNFGNVFDANGNKNNNNYVWPIRGNSTIPKTGQTTCYDMSGTVLSCVGTGQDGDLQNGIAWPLPRFTNNDNSMVADNLTGLIWTKDANAPGPSVCSPAATKTWQGALDYVSCLNSYSYLGYRDWRLPNREELLSLIDHEKSSPALPNGNPFANIQNNLYWSSSSYEGDPSIAYIAWNVDMYHGFTGYYGAKTDSRAVWPVRGGQVDNSVILSVSKSGTGSVTVTSTPAGISCGSTCSASLNSGTVVTLTATPNSNSTIAGWYGCESMTDNTCTVTMSANKNVTVTFAIVDTAFAAYYWSADQTVTNKVNFDAGTSYCPNGTPTACEYAWDFGDGTNSGPASSTNVTISHTYNSNNPVTVTLTVVSSEHAAIPKTGQNTCYDTAGAVLSCAGTGQDGELQKGIAWPSPRFNDNANSTVTDNLTGLIWTKDANAPGPVACSPATTKTWQEALDYVGCLNNNSYLGYTDWRLPNREELLSLIDRQKFSPALPGGHPFANVQPNSYWPSSSYAGGPGISYIAWDMFIDDGQVGYYGAKTDGRYVWPVRGGQLGYSFAAINLPQTGQILCYNSTGTVIDCATQGQTQDGAIRAGKAWPDPRFTDDGDGTVTDNLTTMVWAKDANLMKTRDPGFDADGTAGDGAVNWQHALDYIKKLNNENYLGHNDWRLPNVNEIKSLIDLGRISPALPTGNPFINVKFVGDAFYWSSSSIVSTPSNAWYVLMLFGNVFNGDKARNSDVYVWPVRGGQWPASFQSTVSHTVTSSGANQKPTAAGLVSAYPGATPITITNSTNNVTFTDASSDPDGNGNIQTVKVNWGDGYIDTQAVGSIFTHDYSTRAATYTITHVVYDNGWLSSFEKLKIKIAPPKYVLSGAVTSGGSPLSGVVLQMKLNNHTRAGHISDSNGAYAFPAQLAGDYMLKIYVRGYACSDPGTIHLTGNTTQPITCTKNP